jgi:hypothetical protein
LSLFGTITHLPIVGIAWTAGSTIGTEKLTNDVSVVATMRLLTAFLGCCVAYPTASLAVSAVAGPAAAAATIPFLSLSAYAAVNYPVSTAVTSARGSITLLTQRNAVDALRDQRTDLQTRIREWADDEGDKDMRGWWQDPEGSLEKIRKKQERCVRASAKKSEAAQQTICGRSGLQGGLEGAVYGRSGHSRGLEGA